MTCKKYVVVGFELLVTGLILCNAGLVKKLEISDNPCMQPALEKYKLTEESTCYNEYFIDVSLGDQKLNCVADSVESRILEPQSRRQAAAIIMVQNRHGANFIYNNKQISFREAKKMARAQFESIIIIEGHSRGIVELKDK